MSKHVSDIILGNCDLDDDCKGGETPYCNTATKSCNECKEDTQCKDKYGGEDAKHRKQVCVQGTCELCGADADCKTLFPNNVVENRKKQVCFLSTCKECTPANEATNCLTPGFQTCIKGECKSPSGQLPNVKPDGSKATFRRPWTKNTFQSKVLAPLQKTGNAIQAISTDGASVAKVFGDARRDYIDLLNAATLSLDGMAALNQANNLAFRDKAFENEVKRSEQASSWMQFIIDYTQKLVALEDKMNNRESLQKKDALLDIYEEFKVKDLKLDRDTLNSNIDYIQKEKDRYVQIVSQRTSTNQEAKVLKEILDLIDVYLKQAREMKKAMEDMEDAWKSECKIFSAIFNPDNKDPAVLMEPTMETMRQDWKRYKYFTGGIETQYQKCKTGVSQSKDKVKDAYTKYFEENAFDELIVKLDRKKIFVGLGKTGAGARTGTGGADPATPGRQAANTREADEYTSSDSRIDIALDNNKRLITALIGRPEGDESNNLKKVLDDFTSKLTKKFKNIDTWANGVGTWAGTVKTHTHPITGLGGSGGGVAPVVILPGVTSVAASIGNLSPLAKVTRTFQRSANINNNKTSNRNLTGPLGDGSPITAEDTRVTLNWLNNILPTLNLTKEEEEMLEVLGSEPKLMIELLTRARQDGIEADLQTSKKIRCPFHRCSIYVFSEAQLVDVVSSATTNIGSSANNTSGSFKTFHLKNIIIAKVFRI